MRGGSRAVLSVTTSTALAAVACSLLVDSGGLTGTPSPDASSVDAATVDAATIDGATEADARREDAEGGAPDGGCPPSRAGPALVPVPVQMPGAPYCIDETEVSRDQYNVWVARSIASLPPGCAFKATFTARSGGDTPAAGVDWCDAYAFC